MSETPHQPDRAQEPPRDEYDLAPEESSAPRKDERPLKSIGSLMEGIDEDAASDEKAAARSASDSRSGGVSKFDHHTGKRKPRVLTEEDNAALLRIEPAGK